MKYIHNVRWEVPGCVALLFVAMALLTIQTSSSQESKKPLPKAPNLVLEEYHPKSMLVTEYHVSPKSKFPAIDVHNHLGYAGGKRMMDPAKCIKEMDAAGVAQVVNLDGMWGETLKATIAKFEKAYPGRFLTYARVDWSKIDDPAAFFTPLDKNNERYEELQDHPDWMFYPGFPPLETILTQFMHVVAKHPNTIFIGAHMGCYAENLKWVAQQLDKYPNFYIDIDARISELGRQPYSARKLIIQYQDRVMFGTDTSPNAEAYRVYWQFLETEDEYFDVSKSHHYQGRWMVTALNLPPEVLEKVYYKNAMKLIPGAKVNF
jgi:predicted TIM-barrel fold metal-dependent hydrolase